MQEYIDLKVDFAKRNAQLSGMTLESVVVRSYDTAIKFRIEIADHVLDDTYDVKILSKYSASNLKVMNTLKSGLEIADGKIIYTPKVNLITEADYVRNFLYLSKDGLGLDMAQFNYEVDVSQIGEVAVEVKQVYDESYETLITEFEQALEDYKLTLPQADSVRAEIDVILNQFGVDSQQAIDDLGEVSATAEIAEASRVQAETERIQAEQARKEAETLREENYEQLIDTALIEADVVEKVDNKVTELTPQINNLTAQLAQTDGRIDTLLTLPDGSTTNDARLEDIKVGADGTIYNSPGTAVRTQIGILKDDIDNKISEPPVIKSVPVISDTLNVDTGTFIQNVGETLISGMMYAGLATEQTNYDYIYTGVIADSKKPLTAIPNGMTEYVDKDGVVLEETSNSDLPTSIGRYTFTNTGRLWIYVPKGKYANIGEARADLGQSVLKYQLEMPKTTFKKIGSITKELVSIRKSKEGILFNEAGERIDNIEETVSNFTRYLTPPFIEPPELRSVPAISDTYVNSVLTKNVEQVVISGSKIAGILTSETYSDVVYTEILPFSKFGTGGISGRTFLIDKNFNTMEETDSVDKASGVGKYSHRENGRIWLHVPKGKYSSVEQARTDLGLLSLRYQLETPIVTVVNSGFVCDLSDIRDFAIQVTQTDTMPITFTNAPTHDGIILAVTLNIKSSVNADMTYPNGTVWKGGRTPILIAGKTYMLFFVSYDKGETWLASLTGEW